MVEIARATIAGYRTRLVTRSGEGPPVVLLHGMYDSADTWRGVVRELGARGRRVVAADLPGYGWVQRRRPGPVLPQLDAFVEQLIRDQGPGAVVVGNSLGATLALRVAGRADLDIARVVAIAIPGYGYRPGVGWGVGRRSPLPLIVRGAPLPKRLFTGTAGTTVLSRVLRTSPDSEDFRIAMRIGQMLTDRPLLMGVVDEARTVLGEIDGRIPAPTVPVLIVHGSRDPVSRCRRPGAPTARCRAANCG